MPSFNYKGKDSRGQIRKGTIVAPSKGMARARLSNKAIKVLSLTQQGGKKDTFLLEGEKEVIPGLLIKDKAGQYQIVMGEKEPNMKEIIVFTKQLATMINSGVPLIQSLELLGSQQQNRSFAKTIMQVRQKVENGAKMSDALADFPKIFDNLFVALVRAGETSGALDVILLKLVTYIEKSNKIKKQIKGAMMYPAIVIVVAIGVITLLLVVVVPSMAKQFGEKGLPGITQFVLDMSNLLMNNWMEIIGAIVVAIFGVKFYYKTQKGRYVLDGLMLKSPGVGNLLQKVAIGRFCSTMSTMLVAGVNLIEALTICAASSGNTVIEEFILNIRAQIEKGVKFSDPLAEGTLFPPMVVSMVSVGEQTGALDEMLQKVSEFYEEEVDLAVAAVLSMIEPALLVGLGGIVGFIVIAMYMPIFNIAGTMM